MTGTCDSVPLVRKAALAALAALAGSFCLQEADAERLDGALLRVVQLARSAWDAQDTETLVAALQLLATAAESRGSHSGSDSDSVSVGASASANAVVGAVAELALQLVCNCDCTEVCASTAQHLPPLPRHSTSLRGCSPLSRVMVLTSMVMSQVYTQAFNALQALGTGHAASLMQPYDAVAGGAVLASVVLQTLCDLVSASETDEEPLGRVGRGNRAGCRLSAEASGAGGVARGGDDDGAEPDNSSVGELAFETLASLACTLPAAHVVQVSLAHVGRATASGEALQVRRRSLSSPLRTAARP